MDELQRNIVIGVTILMIFTIIYRLNCGEPSSERYMADRHLTNMAVWGTHMSHAGHNNYIQTGVHEDEAGKKESFGASMDRVKNNLKAKANAIKNKLGGGKSSFGSANVGGNNGKLRERLSYSAIQKIPDIYTQPNPGHQPQTSDRALQTLLTRG